jgi:three-Cys-motif partner protein
MGKAFGGDWTRFKLSSLARYLPAYTKILKKKTYTTFYIDAFAGEGIYTNESENLIFEMEPIEKSGSAKIALDTTPPFDYYYFIELNGENVSSLKALQETYPQKNIRIIESDANNFLLKMVEKWKPEKYRAVLFLDPYGMEVKMETLKAIAQTKSIDVWLLFPAGIGIKRLLKKDGSITDANRKRLNEMFGTEDWEEQLYEKTNQIDLFCKDQNSEAIRPVSVEKVVDYYISLLEKIFVKVSPKYLPLHNSKNSLMFVLLFMVSNPYAVNSSMNISKHIFENPRKL